MEFALNDFSIENLNLEEKIRDFSFKLIKKSRIKVKFKVNFLRMKIYRIEDVTPIPDSTSGADGLRRRRLWTLDSRMND